MRIGKYVGLRNDFLITSAKEIIDAGFEFNFNALVEIAIKTCDRNLGIGADDLLVLGDVINICEGFQKISGLDEADCIMYLINPDGSVAEMTGNGSRCFALYAREHGYGVTDNVGNYTVKIASLAGLRTITYNINDDEPYAKTDMGSPVFIPEAIPLVAPDNVLKVTVMGQERVSYAVSMGNPHWVIPLDSLDELYSEDVYQEGLDLRFDNRFPANVNVNFVFVESRSKIHARTFERGVGETNSCGTGMSGVVAALHSENILDAKCEIQMRGGLAKVEIDDLANRAYLEGPMNKIADIDFVI